MEGLDLGTDLKDRKRPRDRSRDSRKASGTSGLHHMEVSNNEVVSQPVRMPAYLNKTKSEINEAFVDLEWKQRYRLAGAMSDPNSPYKLKRSVSVLQRNRYGNIQPWDGWRVQLKTPIGGSDYINASPIKLNAIATRAKKKLRRTSSITSTTSPAAEGYLYIATQGPKEGQYSHFWHMVMQESVGQVGVIVMLTPCMEGNKEKCAQYFPTSKLRPIVLPPEKRSSEVAVATVHGGDPFWHSYPSTGTDLFRAEYSEAQPDVADHSLDMTEPGQVELVSYSYDAGIGCMIRELRLTIGTQQKTILHYLYEHWPDFGSPKAEERAALLRLMKKSREDAGESPRIVHCSAGVGRTGTFVALDFLTAELEAGRIVRKESASDDDGAEAAGEAKEEQPKSTESYGKSGIAKHKVTTPELRQGDGKSESIAGDLIHDTVESLRQQRMMMVMNEVQYSLLYEVLKDCFTDLYSSKPTGAAVVATPTPTPTPAAIAASEAIIDDVRKSKFARKNSDINMTTSSSPPYSPRESEADTDIADEEVDPYAEVAPETIRENLRVGRKEE